MDVNQTRIEYASLREAGIARAQACLNQKMEGKSEQKLEEAEVLARVEKLKEKFRLEMESRTKKSKARKEKRKHSKEEKNRTFKKAKVAKEPETDSEEESDDQESFIGTTVAFIPPFEDDLPFRIGDVMAEDDDFGSLDIHYRGFNKDAKGASAYTSPYKLVWRDEAPGEFQQDSKPLGDKVKKVVITVSNKPTTVMTKVQLTPKTRVLTAASRKILQSMEGETP